MYQVNKTIMNCFLTLAFRTAESLGISDYDELRDFVISFMEEHNFVIPDD